MSEPAQEHGFVEAEGGRLFVRSWPSPSATRAAPILLLHDSLGCVRLWRGFPARLAEATGRRVIAYDRLGFGRSDPHPGRLQPDFIPEEARTGLAAIRAAMGVREMILVGHSVGGGMAVAAGAFFGEDTQAVVTIAAQSFIEPRTISGIEAAQQAFRDPDQFARLALYHGDKAQWVLDAWTRTWLDPDFAGWTLDDPLCRLLCPILVIHGDSDEYGSEAQPERIAAKAAGRAQVEILPGGGHLPHREQPDLVTRLIADFLKPL